MTLIRGAFALLLLIHTGLFYSSPASQPTQCYHLIMFSKSRGRHRRNTVLLARFAVALLLSTVGEGARFQDQRMISMEPGCRVREYIKYEAEKDGCKSQAVPARGCFGRCQTYEVRMHVISVEALVLPLCGLYDFSSSQICLNAM